MIQLQARTLLRPLTNPIDPDAFLSLLNPRWGTKLRGTIESVTALTADAAAIVIRPGAGWKGHRPGQFVSIGVDVDGVRHHRCYSLTSLPRRAGARRTELISITVQATEHGTVSNHLVHGARPGDVVQLSQADGDFTLSPELPERLLFLTGGSGVTPVLGILRWLAREQPATDVVVLHHATDPNRCLHLDELQELDRAHDRFHVTTTFTRTGEPDAVRLSADRLQELCPDWASRQVYACGPEPLLAFVTEHWDRNGRIDQLHLERFVPATLRPATTHEGSPTAIARFAASDVDVLADGGTPLLEIAEDAGLAPAFGCRMGICHTCSTRLDEGCVRDLRDGRIREAGQHVQICVSAAVDDVVLDL